MRNRYNYQSRLSKRLERQTKKNLLFSILGIIIVVFALIKFGIPLLVNFSLLISGEKISKEKTVNSKTDFIAPPTLNPTYLATNSAEITISGFSTPYKTIDLYMNNNLIDKAQTDSNGNFSFKESLLPGENIVKAKVNIDGKGSEFSESLKIIFKNTPPSLTVNSPSDRDSLKDQIVEVKGTTDPQVRVTVNNFWAIIDENNNFSYTLTLHDGENEIKVIAQDQAGNKTEKTIKVTYNP